MHTLAILFCLIGQPHNGNNCMWIDPPDAIRVSEGIMCFKYGQQYAAVWLIEHPEYEVDHISCAEGVQPRKNSEI